MNFFVTYCLLVETLAMGARNVDQTLIVVYCADLRADRLLIFLNSLGLRRTALGDVESNAQNGFTLSPHIIAIIIDELLDVIEIVFHYVDLKSSLIGGSFRRTIMNSHVTTYRRITFRTYADLFLLVIGKDPCLVGGSEITYRRELPGKNVLRP